MPDTTFKSYSCEHMDLRLLRLPIWRVAWVQRDSNETVFDAPAAPIGGESFLISPNVPTIAGNCCVCGKLFGWEKGADIVEQPPGEGREELGTWKDRLVGAQQTQS